MKQLNNYISEKLIINKNTGEDISKSTYDFTPLAREELDNIF